MCMCVCDWHLHNTHTHYTHTYTHTHTHTWRGEAVFLRPAEAILWGPIAPPVQQPPPLFVGLGTGTSSPHPPWIGTSSPQPSLPTLTFIPSLPAELTRRPARALLLLSLNALHPSLSPSAFALLPSPNPSTPAPPHHFDPPGDLGLIEKAFSSCALNNAACVCLFHLQFELSKCVWHRLGYLTRRMRLTCSSAI
jgi:hypothetical protein